MALHCPFLHHVVEAPEDRDPNGFACGTKSVDAAVQAVTIAEAFELRLELHEAYCLTVDILVMAAITLLVVELGAPTYPAVAAVRSASRSAQKLLESLAPSSTAAAQCLDSLMVSRSQDGLVVAV